MTGENSMNKVIQRIHAAPHKKKERTGDPPPVRQHLAKIAVKPVASKYNAVMYPDYFRAMRYIKYGAPMTLTTRPAGMPTESSSTRPIVSATKSRIAPINAAAGSKI